MSEAHRSEFDRAAKKAVDAIANADMLGRQLGLFEELRPSETRRRSGNKASSALSGWLAAQGYHSPTEALARHAGLHLGGPSSMVAMATVDMIETWACRGECAKDGTVLRFSPEMRAGLYGTVLGEMRKASEALMPYIAKKLSPDVAVSNVQQLMIGLPASGTASTSYAPPPLPTQKPAETLAFEEVENGQSEEGQSEE